MDPDDCFADVIQPPPSFDLPLENLDEDLEHCLWQVRLVLPWYSCVIVLTLIDCSLSQALVLSMKQRQKRAAKSVQVAKIAELEVVMISQADKIAELVAAYVDSKCEKDNMSVGYRRLLEKH
jgi:hypothetical protein